MFVWLFGSLARFANDAFVTLSAEVFSRLRTWPVLACFHVSSDTPRHRPVAAAVTRSAFSKLQVCVIVGCRSFVARSALLPCSVKLGLTLVSHTVTCAQLLPRQVALTLITSATSLVVCSSVWFSGSLVALQHVTLVRRGLQQFAYTGM